MFLIVYFPLLPSSLPFRNQLQNDKLNPHLKYQLPDFNTNTAVFHLKQVSIKPNYEILVNFQKIEK